MNHALLLLLLLLTPPAHETAIYRKREKEREREREQNDSTERKTSLEQTAGRGMKENKGQKERVSGRVEWVKRIKRWTDDCAPDWENTRVELRSSGGCREWQTGEGIRRERERATEIQGIDVERNVAFNSEKCVCVIPPLGQVYVLCVPVWGRLSQRENGSVPTWNMRQQVDFERDHQSRLNLSD